MYKTLHTKKQPIPSCGLFLLYLYADINPKPICTTPLCSFPNSTGFSNQRRQAAPAGASPYPPPTYGVRLPHDAHRAHVSRCFYRRRCRFCLHARRPSESVSLSPPYLPAHPLSGKAGVSPLPRKWMPSRFSAPFCCSNEIPETKASLPKPPQTVTHPFLQVMPYSFRFPSYRGKIH